MISIVVQLGKKKKSTLVEYYVASVNSRGRKSTENEFQYRYLYNYGKFTLIDCCVVSVYFKRRKSEIAFKINYDINICITKKKCTLIECYVATVDSERGKSEIVLKNYDINICINEKECILIECYVTSVHSKAGKVR